jgi:hypothetical protein
MWTEPRTTRHCGPARPRRYGEAGHHRAHLERDFTCCFNFSVERVAPAYDDYFNSVMDVYAGNGWYEPRDGRRDLGSIERRMNI